MMISDSSSVCRSLSERVGDARLRLPSPINTVKEKGRGRQTTFALGKGFPYVKLLCFSS